MYTANAIFVSVPENIAQDCSFEAFFFFHNVIFDLRVSSFSILLQDRVIRADELYVRKATNSIAVGWEHFGLNLALPLSSCHDFVLINEHMHCPVSQFCS